jgi:hypothetical protein
VARDYKQNRGRWRAGGVHVWQEVIEARARSPPPAVLFCVMKTVLAGRAERDAHVARRADELTLGRDGLELATASSSGTVRMLAACGPSITPFLPRQRPHGRED